MIAAAVPATPPAIVAKAVIKTCVADGNCPAIKKITVKSCGKKAGIVSCSFAAVTVSNGTCHGFVDYKLTKTAVSYRFRKMVCK